MCIFIVDSESDIEVFLFIINCWKHIENNQFKQGISSYHNSRIYSSINSLVE